MTTFSTLFNQALALHQKGQLDAAEELYARLLELKPENFDALHFNGLLSFEKRDFLSAQKLLEKAIEIKPEFDELHIHLGHVYKELGHLNQALNHYLNFIEKQPHQYPVLFHIGLIYLELEQWPSAEHYFKQVIQLDPQNAEALNHLALAHKEQRYLMDALQCMQRALKLNNTSVQYAYNYACLLLLLGKYSEGFQYLEKRLNLPGQTHLPQFNKPIWDGSPLNGKRLLIYAEQGFGDTLQFIRYIPLIKEQNETLITLVVQPELYTLLNCLQGVDLLLKITDELPEFETYVFSMSLPHVFKTTLENIPAQTPYLNIRENSEKRLPESKFKVGLSWASGYRDYNRQLVTTYYKKSIPIDELMEYLNLPEIELYSLQIGKDALPEKHDFNIVDLSSEISNFNDTAHFIAQMDLVISVDTATAHLAAAMNKPVWLLLPYVPSWRWLLARSKSPWYPSLRIFRQDFAFRWDEPLQNLREELKVLLSGE